MDRGEKPIRDCRIFDLNPIGGKYRRVSIQGAPGILAFPYALIEARVDIPYPRGIYRVHIRSRLARAGIDALILASEIKKRYIYSGHIQNTASILLMHKGTWQYPVLLREGDAACAIADYLELTRYRSAAPHSEIAPEAISNGTQIFLCIGNQRLRIVEKNLPRFPFSPNSRIPYIDPFANDISSYGKTLEFEEFPVAAGQSFVVSTKEYVKIPRGQIGLLYPIADEFSHTSALVINPGVEGYQALELEALCDTTVRPGIEVMMLSVYECPALDDYNGRYSRQDSIGF